MPSRGGLPTASGSRSCAAAASRPKTASLRRRSWRCCRLSGGEAWMITDLPRSVGNPVWSPDGKHIAFLCDANADDLAKKQKKDAAGEAEHESDVKVITRAIYRFNGQGYTRSQAPPVTSGLSMSRRPAMPRPLPSSLPRATSTKRSPLSLPTAAASSSTPTARSSLITN